MANVLIFNICLLLLTLSHAESCFIPDSLYVVVPNKIHPGYEITKVQVADCDAESMHLTLEDPNFTIESNGVIVARSAVWVTAKGRTFSVWAQDNTGPRSEMEVHLVPKTMSKGKYSGQSGFLKRSKRRWSPPPFNIMENEKGPFPREIENIVSDSEMNNEVYYTISGPGYNEEPVGVFKLDSKTGMLSVLKAVDREKYPSFTLRTKVFQVGTDQETDDYLDITILVDDENDNPPEFVGAQQLTVPEQSRLGTVVGKVNATDKDKEGTQHVMIKYTLLDNEDRFIINGVTGVITTKTSNLDREVMEKYLVTVKLQDWSGAAKGLTNTGTVTIALGDINDNPPTFSKTSYQATVPENEMEKLILRIPVEDKDLKNTPNWISKFVITKGNEKGHFRIDNDPKTNEGLLYVTKPLNYELNKNVKLEVRAENEAKLIGTTASWPTVPVEVIVTDVDEGPEFTAPTIRLTVKENTPNGTVIGTNLATDPETKSSEGIKYYKVTDPASWINVDQNTAELRVANTIDRESPFVQNGIYNITMKAVDSSSKTGTGTVIIMVEDVNDHAPTIPGGELVVCETEKVLGSVYLVAEDKDASPFSDPFSFSLPDDSDGKWSLTTINGTAARLTQTKDLPTGIYNVPVEITDLQGFSKKQSAKVRICRCRNGACMPNQSSVSLGSLSVLATLLPLALLLLLFLLLALFCTTKGDIIKMPDIGDSGGILLKSNTEAPGEEVDSSLITVPFPGNDGTIVKGSYNEVNAGNYNNGTIGVGGGLTNWSNGGMEQVVGSGGRGGGSDSQWFLQNSAFHHTWQTHKQYLHQKIGYLGTTEDARYADDITHSYTFEGVGSAAGTVGCCSDYGEDDNLDFVNTLGPKFKTLADVCKKT